MPRKRKGQSVTTDELARMISDGVVAKMVTKDDFKDLKLDMDSRFDDVDTQLNRIEFQHNGRIERLEDEVRVIKTKLGIT